MEQTKLKTYILLAEPELEIEEPRVWVQPPRPPFPRWEPKLERLLRQTQDSYLRGDNENFSNGYNLLLYKFRCLFTWALDSWDYLITTQGCRFLERPASEQVFHRSNYRAFTRDDYHKLIHRIFKENVLKYKGGPGRRFSCHLSDNFWQSVLEEYEGLNNPADSRQRKLTPYSYLRCIPYRFLSFYHQERVEAVLDHLPGWQREIIDLYFLSFYTIRAIAREEDLSLKDARAGKKEALSRISSLDPLTHALLLQIERY